MSHQDMVGGTTVIDVQRRNSVFDKEKGAVDDDESDISDLPDGAQVPTEEELGTLRKVSDKLPWSAFLVALVELCERFAYYGLSGPFQNYMQNEWGDPAVPGAIG